MNELEDILIRWNENKWIYRLQNMDGGKRKFYVGLGVLTSDLKSSHEWVTSSSKKGFVDACNRAEYKARRLIKKKE